MNLTCPFCGHGNTDHTCVGPIPAVPHDGDYSLCIAAGFWSVFEDDSIRPPEAVELAEIIRNPDCLPMMDAWVKVMKPERVRPC